MKIAFESVPLISDRMTGIGYCEAGQVKALIKNHPEDKFEFQFFEGRDIETKKDKLAPYMHSNVSLNSAAFSGFAYRVLENFINLPYSAFFGKNADVTHFFNYIVPPKVKTATVATVHDMVYKAYPETMSRRTKIMFDLSLRRSMKRATLIVTDSEFSKDEIIKYYPKFENKIRVVPCGVDFSTFNSERDETEIARVRINFGIHGDYFLYLGTLEPRKNLTRLLCAYAELKKEAKTADKEIPYLVLAGAKGWQYNEIFNKVSDLGIKDNVIFTKYVPDEDLKPLICGALAFCFPSIYEGFGLPPLEAMACGVPVLVSDAASLPEVVGDAALIVDAFNIMSIKNGLKRLATESKLRKELAEKGKKRAAGFTWEASAKKLYDVYEEAIDIYRSGKKL